MMKNIRITQKTENLTVGKVYHVYGMFIDSMFIFDDNCDAVWLYDLPTRNYEPAV